jgi:hypothetical protein
MGAFWWSLQPLTSLPGWSAGSLGALFFLLSFRRESKAKVSKLFSDLHSHTIENR